MRLSRQEYWNGCPGFSPGDLPHPGTKSASLDAVYNRFTLQSRPEVKSDNGVAPSSHHRPHCQTTWLQPQLTKTRIGRDKTLLGPRDALPGTEGKDCCLSLGQKTKAQTSEKMPNVLAEGEVSSDSSAPLPFQQISDLHAPLHPEVITPVLMQPSPAACQQNQQSE